jgi:hypothetical protein
MIKTLTTEDIRDLLNGFAAAIELDQIRVDALHPDYDPDMWRMLVTAICVSASGLALS